MNRYIISKVKIVSGNIGEKRNPRQNRADEELCKKVRRAVKNAVVPAGLEAKIWNSIRAQA